MNKLNYDKSFNKVFYTLSFFFLFYFYILPLVIISKYYTSIDIAYNLNINDSRILLAWVSLLLFVLGFVILDVIKFVFRKRTYKKLQKYKTKKIFVFFIIFYILILFYTYINISSDYIYAVRKGEVEGSWSKYFITLFIQGMKFTIVFILLKLKINKGYIILFLFISIFIGIKSGIGRFDLLLDIIIIVMLIFNIRAMRMSLLIFIGLFLMMPLLFNLKSLIFMLATDTFRLESVIDLLSKPFDYSLYINNFGHPVVSILMIDELIAKTGYRYLYDYIHDFIFYLRIVGLDISGTLTYYNSENLLGKFQSIVPPGYLAYGYVQLGLLGVFISGIVYRVIGLLGKKIYLEIAPESNIVKFTVAFLFANSFYHGEIRILILTLLLKFGIILILMKSLLKGIKNVQSK